MFYKHICDVFEKYGDKWIMMVLWECHYDLEEYKRLVKEEYNPSVSFMMSKLFRMMIIFQILRDEGNRSTPGRVRTREVSDEDESDK